MSRLNGTQIERLRRALLAAFPSDDKLRELVVFDFSRNLNEFAGNNLPATCLNLIQWAIAEARTHDLITKATARNPTNPELMAIGKELLPVIENAHSIAENVILPEPVSSETASRGITELVELIRDPAARNVVGNFSSRLTDSYNRILTLSNYKVMHDLLHRLRAECYEPTLRIVEDTQSPEIAKENLFRYKQNLVRIITDLKLVRLKNPVVRKELVWIEELVSLREEFEVALQSTNQGAVKIVARKLNIVISLESSQINSLLKSAASALNLFALIESLGEMEKRLKPLKLDAKRFRTFTIGLRDLRRVASALRALVERHDEWQVVENILGRVESLLDLGGSDQFLTDLEVSWPGLKSRIQRIYRGKKEQWEADLARDSELLDIAIQTRDANQAKRHFQSYRREAFQHFYRVDFTLKEQCNELQKMGESIRAALEMIQ
jgi:hypothetical protein